MTTKKQFLTRCKKLDIEIDDNGFCLAINAPNGFVFGTYGTHSEAINFNDGWKMSEIYGEFMHIMKDGVIECDDEDCEVCL